MVALRLFSDRSSEANGARSYCEDCDKNDAKTNSNDEGVPGNVHEVLP
jgi:hypothetical protein